MSDTQSNEPLARTACSVTCHECGGSHEPSGSRSDCIRHWKLRALQAEEENPPSIYTIEVSRMKAQLRCWLDEQQINGETIGNIRRLCFMPFACEWNGFVRDETAAREKSPNRELSRGDQKEAQ